MPLTRLDNLISSKTGKYLYVSPDDFNATDSLSNRGNSPVTPFKSIQRAFLEVARYSYLPGFGNDRFDQFSIMLMPGIHYIDNRPGLIDTTSITEFPFDQATNAWGSDPILDISNPDNVLYKFNNTEGGAIIPRGSSLVGYDLRRTTIRPLYVPDPATTENEIPRSAIFNVTGGCYFWQFTIKDGQTTSESPLFDAAEGTGKVYYDPNDFTKLAAPNYSHHKLTVFEYADKEELALFYRKIAKAFAGYQPTIDDPGEFDFNIQENRIVGPLSDSRVIESLKLTDATTDSSIAASTAEIEVTTKVDHGYFQGQFVAIANTEIDDVLEGIFPVKEIDQNDPRKFTYEVPFVVSAIGSGNSSGDIITQPTLGANAQTLAEVDSVESASPYVFNVSIRSTWGICGIWANGLKATGFKSMVIAQYTGVSLQKDDRAFIRYDEYSNTWNQASLVDAFATVPYHTKGDSYWKDEWRNFHVRASVDAFIQNVSIFAVGFADHFLMESGGDMSITNSNSNFGNTSLHAIGFKGFAFNQDKGGYITDIIPPKVIETGAEAIKKVQYYTVDIQGTIAEASNYTKLYLGSNDIIEPIDRPAVTLDGYRIGAKTDEQLYVNLDPIGEGSEEFNVTLEPTGFVKYIAAPSILNPSGFSINSVSADAANLIESNRTMIQEEVFGYILEKFPRLQNISYVNPGRDPQANRYFDARNLLLANRSQIINDALDSGIATFGPVTVTFDDVALVVDAITEDIRDGGNANLLEVLSGVNLFNNNGALARYTSDTEREQLLWIMNRARDLCKKAVANLLNSQADIYDPNPNSIFFTGATNNYPEFISGKGYTGSEAEEANLSTNAVTIDVANTQDPAGRYKDARNRILANRDYILDNALAEIAVYDTTNFSFPGDTAETEYSRFKTAYRLIRRNRDYIADQVINQIQATYPTFVFPGGTPDKCKRDIGFFIDAVGLDIFLDGNYWTRQFILQYFDGGTWVAAGLQGETEQSEFAFNQARNFMQLAVSNQLGANYTDTNVLQGESIYGDGNGDVSNTDVSACADVQNAIATLTTIVTNVIDDENTDTLTDPANPEYILPTTRTLQANESKCRRDIGHVVDAIAQDLWFGGNEYTIAATRAYFDRSGIQLNNGLSGEEQQSITAFKRIADAANQAINNQLYDKDFDITLDAVGDPPVVGDLFADAHDMVLNNKEFIANEAYQRMINDPLFSSYVPRAGTSKQDCLDDVYSVLTEVMWNVKFGGNQKAWDSAEIYVTGIWAGANPRRFTPTTATYDPATGVSVLTIPGHGMSQGQYIKIAEGGLTFSCELNGQSETSAYPRVGDGNYNTWMVITAADTNTITVNVGNISDPAQRSDHTFVSALANSVTYGTDQTTFLDAERDEAKKVFEEVKAVGIQVIRNEEIGQTSGNDIAHVRDLTIVDDWETPTCAAAVSAFETLMDFIIDAIGTDAGVGTLPVAARTEPVQPDPNSNFPQPGGYTPGNCSDVLQTIDTLVGILCDALADNSLATLPPLTHGEWDCANVRSSIENLFDIATDAFNLGSNADLPLRNEGSFITDATQSKCYRDVSYIVDAVVNDLRFGGNVNSVQAGEAYYVGNELDYIDGEAVETVDAWNYVGQMAIAAMRNFDVVGFECSTTLGSSLINVGDTRGLLIGMEVVEYTEASYRTADGLPGQLGAGPTRATNSPVPEGSFIMDIVDSETIKIGFAGSRFDTGAEQTCSATSTVKLHFAFTQGAWADTDPKTVTVGLATDTPTPAVLADTLTGTVVPDPNNPGQTIITTECASTADAITTLIGNITTIITSGPGSVTRSPQTTNLSDFSRRATIFTINTSGTGASNPHNFETGTPVRLVPRPRFDYTLGKYVDVDKRLIRLPKGFETNTTYYVIAPGRSTEEGGTDYSGTTAFNGSDQTKLMLATSKENAAAGIYIYASESESIDPNVEIDLYQFVLDDKYDLHAYNDAKLSTSVANGIQTETAHIFDVPNSAVEPQRVFFRANAGSDLPLIGETQDDDPFITTTDTADANVGRLNPLSEFYVAYANPKTIKIYKTHSDAINDNDPVTFIPGNYSFKVYANKRRSPVRFNPGFTDTVTDGGKWYIQVKPNGQSTNTTVREQDIIWRIRQEDLSDRKRTTDMWFTRLEDDREADDRTYKIRYVIPKYLENARDPINGFVIKTRTDDTRKLVPQKVLLKPVAGNVYGATFKNPVQDAEKIGFTQFEFDQNSLDLDVAYDPYKKDLTNSGIEYKRFANFSSGVRATIQTGRYVADALDPNISYLELTVYDHSINVDEFAGLKNETLTTVKISAPQGGEFVVNKTANETSNEVAWSGNSSGLANIHGYFNVGSDHYLIIKNTRAGKLEFSEYYNTRFTQGNVFADMLEDQDMGKSLPLKTLIRKNYPEYFYKQNGANVYTITPGDRITDAAGIEYYVDKVEDAGVIEDTFYIFNYETLQRRIAGQQDGVYYLSCLRGNISPFPTGAGVAENFRKFKFSQPVSSLYPLNYKNDPLWFQKAGTSDKEIAIVEQYNDPPATFSAADNYIHGLVTTNDFKNSVTKELVTDLIEQPAFRDNEYLANAAIRAQEGNATSGAEDRKISIAGTDTVVANQRYYVELRRPSIARAGNHTFEYLGFGPGNYSTGLPARQEIVLTPTEDFYAQSKKQDAGIVFYTGLNSNGDLYIGNRKINAITGEETFLEQASLRDSEDDNDELGNLVTTFNTAVTFNENITIVGGDGSLPNIFNSPITISVQDEDLTESRDCLIIRSNVSSIDPVTFEEQDESLDNFNFTPRSKGDIRISKNRVQAAVFGITARRNGQDYKVQTHEWNSVPSNISPNNNPTVAGGGDRVYPNQLVNYNGVGVTAGDILLKGLEVGKTGSLGWVFANFYQQIPANEIDNIEFDGTNVVKLTFIDQTTGLAVQNQDVGGVGINSATQIRFSDFWVANDMNGVNWTVFSPEGDAFDPTNNYVHFQVVNNQTVDVLGWNDTVIATRPIGSPVPTVDFSNSNWKEVGVIGAEALRTDTNSIGEYKLGVNTVARSAHVASQSAFTSIDTEPRANLDVVGTAFISGKTIENYLNETTSNKTETEQNNAFLVGGDSANPDDEAVLRVMTTNGGRFGINTKVTDTVNPFKELNKTFVVIGDARIHENLEITGDLEVNGGDLTTTNNTLNVFPENGNILNMFGEATSINAFSATSVDQTINIANQSGEQTVTIGAAAVSTTLRVHPNSQSASVDIATVANDPASTCNITLGGAFSSLSDASSYTRLNTFVTQLAGNLEIGRLYGAGTSTSRIYTTTRTVDLFDGEFPNTINFGPNATTFTLGSTGGTTTIRNTLNVLASTIVEGNIRLDGGLSAGIIEIGRGEFGTDEVGHVVGGVENPNIDFYKYQSTGRFIDTAGVSPWGSTAFLLGGGQIGAFTNVVNNGGESRPANNYTFVPTTTDGGGNNATFNVLVRSDKTIEISIASPGEGYAQGDILTIDPADLGGTESGASVPAGTITLEVTVVNSAGSSYFLPITTPSPTDFRVGDLLLIDRGNDGSPTDIDGVRDSNKSEIVSVTGIANVNNPADPNGYRLIVTRGVDGTGVYTDHPDNCVIAKLDKQTNASYITGSDLDSDGVLDEPLSGIGSGSANVRIGVAEFGGTLSTQDFLRLSKAEFVSIVALISTTPQTLSVNDGGDPAVLKFEVESTTGNTKIAGDILAGSGFDKFVVDELRGDTVTQGTLTTNNTIMLRGSTFAAVRNDTNDQFFKLTPQGNTEFLTLTNGGREDIPERVTFQVDTATGSIYSAGGDIRIYGQDGTTDKLRFINSSGDFTVWGSFSALGTGVSTFGGSLDIDGGINMEFQGGVGRTDIDSKFEITNIQGNSIFKVDNDGSVDVSGITNYFSSTGGRKWKYAADNVIEGEANINYFVNAGGPTIFKLPANAQMGDMIQIIDIGGSLTYNLSLVVRAPDNIKVMNDVSNTGAFQLLGIPASQYAGWNGGELVVQTPRAAFGLVYAGGTDVDGGGGVASGAIGWYLINV